MQDTDVPPQRGDADDTDDAEAEATADEASMRLALERLGTRSSQAPRAAGNRANATPRSRTRFVRDGEVRVVRVPSVARLPGEAGRELAEERAARLQAEAALAEAQGTIGRLQAARARAEQALQAAQAAVEEREAAMAGLRAELAHAAQREAALVEAARVEAKTAKAAARPKPEPAPSRGSEPVRWWLEYVKAPRS